MVLRAGKFALNGSGVKWSVCRVVGKGAIQTLPPGSADLDGTLARRTLGQQLAVPRCERASRAGDPTGVGRQSGRFCANLSCTYLARL